MESLKIVGIGGGTGLPALLEGLGVYADIDVSAVVTVADNGGSSGRLRDGFGMPAVGDLRNCLVALSGDDSLLANLFQHRFSGGSELDGHALGNLIVAALHQKTGSLNTAIAIASKLLPMRGRALPSSDMPATLCAEFDNGSTVKGESQISAAGGRIQRIWLEPQSPPPSPGVLEAIESADAIVLGPGSLYTSLLPNFLVAGAADAVRQSRAVRILVCNLLTQPGETDDFSASDHLRIVEDYLGAKSVDYCVVNTAAVSCLGQLLSVGVKPVACDSQRILSRGSIPVKADLVMEYRNRIRHNPKTLARLIVGIARLRANAAHASWAA